MSCGGADNGAVSHKNSEEKSSVTLQWKAPSLPSGTSKTVEFKFTAVQDYSTFWVAVPAVNIINVEGVADASEPQSEPETEHEDDDDDESHAESEAESEHEAESEAEGEGVAEGVAELEEKNDPNYEDCGKNKGCFGIGSDQCVEEQSCSSMVQYQIVDDKVKIKLLQKTDSSSRYVAVAFSENNEMNEDFVVYCPTSDGASAKISWNTGKHNEGELDSSGVSIETTNNVSYVDGVRQKWKINDNRNVLKMLYFRSNRVNLPCQKCLNSRLQIQRS